MKIIRSYKSLLVYVVAFVLSHSMLLCKAPEAMAATLTASETSTTWVRTFLWWGETRDDWDDKGTYHRLVDADWVDDAYVNYTLNINGEPGWYKISHGSLADQRKDRDNKAIYEVYAADKVEYVDVNQRQIGNDGWESDDWYCFDSNKDLALKIISGAAGDYGSKYTYAPKTLALVKDESRNITSCTEVKHSITVELSAGGRVEGSIGADGPTEKEHDVLEGSSPSYTFIPADGYVIESITAEGTTITPESGEHTYVFEPVYDDQKIKVDFIQATYTISASVNDVNKGTISPSGEVSVSTGANQTFDFTPSDGNIVSEVKVDGVSVMDSALSLSSYTFLDIQANHTIAVQFATGHVIEPSCSMGGSITPNSTVSVLPGGRQTFSIIPDSCYEIGDVIVKKEGESNDLVTDTPPSYEFLDVRDNYTIHADFNMVGGNLTISSVSSVYATISPEGEETIGCGGSQDYKVEYKAGAEDLYVYINNIPTKILEAGEPLVVPGYTHNVSDRSFTFNISGITENTVIRLHDVVELADYPLDIVTRPAPPNIMFVLDDSGSMDFEFMTEEEGGDFSNEYFVFRTNDIQYDSGKVLSGDQKKMWNSQYFGYNKLYYNPSVVYQPWPTLDADDVSTEFKVRSHPIENSSPNFFLSSDYTSFGWHSSAISIPNAHYYVKSGTNIILIVLDHGNDQIKYYKVTGTSGSGSTQKVTSIKNIDEAGADGYGADGYDVKIERTFQQEAQNFANWFTFYRKRELTATAAISQVIDQVSNTYVGIRTINASNSYGIKKPLTPIRVMYLGEDGKFVVKNEIDGLLDSLYKLEIDAKGTPLKSGFKKVGEYYDQTDNSNGDLVSGYSEDSPWLGNGPWFKSSLGGACQQSFTIAMTDGFYSGSVSGIGNEDKDSGAPYADGYSGTLADIAMYYYDKDLVPSLSDNVPGEGRQHMKTYSVAFGVNGTLGDPDGYTLVPDCVGQSCNYPKWPNPNDGDSEKIDDLFHAAVNGRGLYLNAGDPEELVDSLTDIIVDISDQSGSAASVSINGDQFYSDASSGDLLMYQTQYVSPDWVGRVYAYQVKTNGTVDTDDPVWEASDRLDDALSDGANQAAVAGRVIATYSDKVPKGIKFDKLENLSIPQQALFEDGLEGTSSEDLFQYIRGSNAKESSTLYRERQSRLGDIVNSGALYHDGYLYVGANDGMMHAFDGKTGEEKFAYIPSVILPSLKKLASQTYGDGHSFFVDGTPVVTKMGDTSYLVGGLGRGGNGYYSINVTDQKDIKSSSRLADEVLWEYPQANTPEDEWTNDLGNTFSKAHTVKSYADITSGDGNKDLDGYVTFFGNGYGSSGGDAVLYFLNPTTGKLIRKINVGGTAENGMGTPVAIDVNNDNKMDYIYAGDLEGNMWKFDVRDEDPGNWQVAYCEGGNNYNSCQESNDNIELKPLVKTANNQAITSSPDVIRHPSGIGYMVVFGTGRFLSVSDWDDLTTQSFYGIWDFGDDDDDTEYLGQVKNGRLVDENGQERPFSPLLEQTEIYFGEAYDSSGNIISPTSGSTEAQTVRVLSNNKPDWKLADDENDIPKDEPQDDPQVHVGWFFDLPLDGEKTTVDAIIRDDKAILVSFIPNGDRCAGGAQSLVHELNVYTGGRLDSPSFDLNGDGVIDEKDMVRVKDKDGNWILVAPSAILKDGRLQAPSIIGLGKDSDIEVKHFSSSSGEIETVVEKAEDVGIYYWREF